MNGVPFFDGVDVEVSRILDRGVYIRRNPIASQQFSLNSSFAESTHRLRPENGFRYLNGRSNLSYHFRYKSSGSLAMFWRGRENILHCR